MSSETDIEKQLMMEMEQEVKNAKHPIRPAPVTPTTYPSFELSPMYDKYHHDDALQSEVEQALRRVQQERQSNGDSPQFLSYDGREHLVDVPPQKENLQNFSLDNVWEPNQNYVQNVGYFGDNREGLFCDTPVEEKRTSEEQAMREAVEQARREAEEQARLEAEEQARREAKEQARRIAEEQARREAKEQARRDAEEQARREAEEQATREAVEQARREALEQARREAEEQARREAEEQARREAEEQARREAEEQARREAEEQARREAEEQARREAEEQARREAEEQARLEAEEQARREAEEEAEEQARREAEEQARREAEEQATREAVEQARREALEQARREAEEQAKLEAEEQARREAEEQARREALEQARREAEEQARREAEEQARREALEQARREAEEQAKLEAEEQARREAEEQARREALEQARLEAEEQARREAEEQARREAEEQARREAVEQARREALEQARLEAEEQARREAVEQARREAEEQARREAEEQARREAEEQARREAEEQARREAEEQARREAEEQARREAEEQARREALEQARREAEERAKREAEEQARREAEEQARREAVEQARREVVEQVRRETLEQARLQFLEEARRKVEEEAVSRSQNIQRSDFSTDFSSELECNDVEVNSGKNGEDMRKVSVLGASLKQRGKVHSEDSCVDGSESVSESRSLLSTVYAGAQNDNGLLCSDNFDIVFCGTLSDDLFEELLARELRHLGVNEEDLRQPRIERHQYETIREPGRCLYPVGDERADEISAVNIQLGFFRSKQDILTGVLFRQKRVAKRERRAGSGQRELSSVHCYFESELLQDENVTFDDDHLPHNALSECVMTERELITSSPVGSVNRALERMTFGDPIQLWECARGHSFDLTNRSSTARSVTTRVDGLTTGLIWSNDIDTKKPTTAVSVFSGGALIQVQCVKLSNPMFEIHGNAVDPLLVAAAFYSVSGSTRVKVSETFFFGSSVDIFYPHKERTEVQRDNRSVVFIPREFRSSLYLVVRVYRPSSEDFDDYVDLYSRPNRYKNHHVAPMKEKTQLLAMSSDVLEEMGWNFVHCSGKNGESNSTLVVKKLFRKQVDEAQMYRVIKDEQALSAMSSISFDMEFSLTDCSNHEVTFPSSHAQSRPEENETTLSLLNPDVKGAVAEICRYVPCAIPILNSGFFHAYHNIFYFRLNKINIVHTNALRKIPYTHRTFVVRICIKDQDMSLSEEGLPLIYGNRVSGQTLETSAWSSTVHSSFGFVLSDEFKIQLPLYLTDNHHIFLTLYASFQRRGPSDDGLQRLYKVGYAAFPFSRQGVVQVKENWSIKFVSAEQATVIAAGGYLHKFADAPVSALLNNGSPVLTASTQARTSVHASNKTIAGIFRDSPESLRRITEDDDVLSVSGQLTTQSVTTGDTETDNTVHKNVTSMILKLPLAEILAFYPFLSFYSLALISSPSRRLSLSCRTDALVALIDITFKTHHYDANTQSRRQRNMSSHALGSLAVAHTSVTSVLYHHITNDVLYSGKIYRLYAGVAEVWLHLLSEINSDNADVAEGADVSPAKPSGESARWDTRILKKQMADVSWFLFDVILRSIYLFHLDNPKVPRTELLDASFYDIIGRLCTQTLHVLCGFASDGVLVSRVALFVRNLSNFCDRGRVLGVHKRVLELFEQQGDSKSICAYLRLVLDAPDALTLMFPSSTHGDPVFLTRIVIQALAPLIVHVERSIRVEASAVLYNFLCVLSNNPRVTPLSLRLLAAQLFTLLTAVAKQWKNFVQLCDKCDAEVSVRDKQQVVVSMLWILYYVPRGVLRRWLRSANDGPSIAGFMSIVSDAQVVLRFNGGVDKAESKVEKIFATELREWDARMSTFTAVMGARLCSILIEDIPHVLRMVKNDRKPAAAFNYFVMLENVVSLGHSTLALQFGAAALFETVCALFPEIMSCAARMSSGMVLLVFRLMSSCCQHVRSIAGRTFFFMSQSFFRWTGSLARIKSIAANALVSVAESKVRSLRLAGRFVEFQLEELVERAGREGTEFDLPEKDYNTRYDKASSRTGGDSGTQYRYRVPDLFLSVTPNIPVSHPLLDRCDVGSDGEKSAGKRLQEPGKHSNNHGAKDVEVVLRFSDEFSTLSKVALSLFCDVLRLQVDRSMKFKENRIFAYFEIFRNFLRQNALSEVLKWLNRLQSAHKGNSDMAEAGMVLIFSAALCFRVTEVFYLMRGRDSLGARMPVAVLSHVFWHDYVRVLPELDTFLQLDVVCTIVSDLHVCPEDSLFSIEGQVKALKDAAEHLDKDQYYDFSLGAASIVEKYLRATGDFKGASTVHSAMATWCQAIAQQEKRQNHRYFLLWARMERAETAEKRREVQYEGECTALGGRPDGLPEGQAIKRVHKVPPAVSHEDFIEYAKSYVEAFFEDPSLVVVTEDLSDTSPALPESVSRKIRVRAMPHVPNHCWVSVFEVHPSFPKDEPALPDGFDKTMHIQKFENIMHMRPKTESVPIPQKPVDLMNHHMSINTYTLERAFPSTTSAIDVSETSEVLLDAFQTAQETIVNRIDIMKQTPENDMLIVVLRDALSPMGISPPGAYMKEVIATMSGYPDVIQSVRSITTIAREKLNVCEKFDAMTKAPDDYALVLKAVTDMECCLIAFDENSCSNIDQYD